MKNTDALKETLRKSYLWRNYFDEFIEKTELAHFTVKPFPAVFHTRLQNLEKEYNAKHLNKMKSENSSKLHAKYLTHI